MQHALYSVWYLTLAQNYSHIYHKAAIWKTTEYSIHFLEAGSSTLGRSQVILNLHIIGFNSSMVRLAFCNRTIFKNNLAGYEYLALNG